MNEANKKYLWKLIQLTGDSLVNKLPDHPNHPNGSYSYPLVQAYLLKFGGIVES